MVKEKANHINIVSRTSSLENVCVDNESLSYAI